MHMAVTWVDQGCEPFSNPILADQSVRFFSAVGLSLLICSTALIILQRRCLDNRVSPCLRERIYQLCHSSALVGGVLLVWTGGGSFVYSLCSRSVRRLAP